MWVKIILFLLLGICAVFDSIRQEIPLAVVWTGIALAVIWHLWSGTGEMTWAAAMLSVLPGILFVMAAAVLMTEIGRRYRMRCRRR